MVVYLDENEFQIFNNSYTHYTRENEDYEIIKLYGFDAVPARDVCGLYIDLNYEKKPRAKKSGNCVETLISRLMLNSLYGKFGSKQFAKTKCSK